MSIEHGKSIYHKFKDQNLRITNNNFRRIAAVVTLLLAASATKGSINQATEDNAKEAVGWAIIAAMEVSMAGGIAIESKNGTAETQNLLNERSEITGQAQKAVNERESIIRRITGKK